MNVNKKLDRLKQWAGERMGGEAKTNVSDDFKALEIEMGLRHEGMEKLHKSMTLYTKAMSKRNEGEDKEKTLPVAYLGGTMIGHGEDFESDSEFGRCLTTFGQANERIARTQETYVASATSSWLESLERSLAQMKEYQAARKKLETRRLAYDAALAKMQKAKKEDFRVEEELRSQKAKYEESSEDVYRRMQDIKEAESESVADLGSFLDAELAYYDKCRDVLLQLKREWPATQSNGHSQPTRRNPRPRSNTAHSYSERYAQSDDEPAHVPEAAPRPSIKSQRATSSHTAASSPARNPDHHFEPPRIRPAVHRAQTTFEGPTQLRRDVSPASAVPMTRVPSDSLSLQSRRTQLRNVSKIVPENDVFHDPSEDSGYYNSSSPERSYPRDRSVSPATSHGSGTTLSMNITAGKKGPPPPPPSRSKKPPPPPPMKRAIPAGDY